MNMTFALGVVAAAALAACAPEETAEPAPAGPVAEDAAADPAPDVASGHGSLNAPTRDDIATRVTAADKDRAVAVAVGTKIAVELIGVPTAGYIWSVAEAPAFLVADGEANGPTSTAQLEPGFSGGDHWEVFFFAVTGPGSGLLRLEQRRPWESDEAAADVFTVEIVATESD